MALVVFLRGLNVGGHRRIRPSALAGQLKHLDAVNIGAAGTMVFRRPVGRSLLKAEIRRRMPFDTEITICRAQEIRRLLSLDVFAGHPVRPGITRFVSILSRLPRTPPPLPLKLPPGRRWLLQVLARDGRFVLGLYKRRMKVIGSLGSLDRLFGTQVTTRNWNTIRTIVRILDTKRG